MHSTCREEEGGEKEEEEQKAAVGADNEDEDKDEDDNDDYEDDRTSAITTTRVTRLCSPDPKTSLPRDWGFVIHKVEPLAGSSDLWKWSGKLIVQDDGLVVCKELQGPALVSQKK